MFEELASENAYYRHPEEEALSLINDLKYFFNSGKPAILQKMDFKRLMSYLHLVKGFNTVDDLTDVLVSLFRNQEETEIRNIVKKYLDEYNESQKPECDIDEQVIAGSVLYTHLNNDIAIEDENFLSVLNETWLTLSACTKSQIERGIEIAKEIMQISSTREFDNKSEMVINALRDSYLFYEVSELVNLFQIIEKIFPSIPQKDLYKVLTVINEQLDLNINENFEIMLNQSQLLSGDSYHKYDKILERLYSDMLLQKCYKYENEIYYFSPDQEASASYIHTDVAGMYSIIKSQEVLSPDTSFIYSYNPELKELRVTKEYSFLSDWTRFSDLDEGEKPIYKMFMESLLVMLYEGNIFTSFGDLQSIMNSIFVNKNESKKMTVNIFGGELKFDFYDVLIIPTTFNAPIGKLITPHCNKDNEINISSLKRTLQVQLFDTEGKIKSEYVNKISFVMNNQVQNIETGDLYKNLKAIDRREAQLLCNLERDTLNSLYKSFALENIPTKYFKVLVETILFNKGNIYNLSEITCALYNRFNTFFSKGYCNLENSNRILSALISNSISSTDLIEVQALISTITEQVVNSEKKCTTFKTYPATLSQIPEIIKAGGKKNVMNVIKKIYNGIKTDELEDILQLPDDLQIYVALKKSYKRFMQGRRLEDPKKVDEIRGDARVRELAPLLRDIKNNESQSNFVYLDYGGGEGGITRRIAQDLKLPKDRVFSLDIEDWYGNIFQRPYNNDITYRLVKPLVALPFKDNSVDLITCFQVLHHIEDIEYYVSEIIRILKPGGYLVLREHDCNNDVVRMLIDVEHMLFECVTNKDEGINGKYLFEYKDSMLYKPIKDWEKYLASKGLSLDERTIFSDLYNTVKSETRYVYRVFRKTVTTTTTEESEEEEEEESESEKEEEESEKEEEKESGDVKKIEKAFSKLIVKNNIKSKANFLKHLPFRFEKILGEGVGGVAFIVDYKGQKGVIKAFKTTYNNIQTPFVNELYSSLYLSGKKYFPKVYNVFYADDSTGRTQFYIFSEFIKGKSLSSFIKEITTEKEMKKLKNRIVEIIEYFCDKNIIHLDFHMDNIIVVPNGKSGPYDYSDYNLKVIDFGYTLVHTKCNPYADLLKFISYLYAWDINNKFADMLMQYFLETYGDDKELYRTCLDPNNKKDILISPGEKPITTSKMRGYLDNKDYKNFSFTCYRVIWSINKPCPISFFNIKNPEFNYRKNDKVTKISLEEYMDKFAPLFLY